jgi:hypothetical protein
MMPQDTPLTAGPVHLTDLEIDRGYLHEDFFETEDWRIAAIRTVEEHLSLTPAAPLA